MMERLWATTATTTGGVTRHYDTQLGDQILHNSWYFCEIVAIVERRQIPIHLNSYSFKRIHGKRSGVKSGDPLTS